MESIRTEFNRRSTIILVVNIVCNGKFNEYIVGSSFSLLPPLFFFSSLLHLTMPFCLFFFSFFVSL